MPDLLTCPSCSAVIVTGSRYCPGCGAPVRPGTGAGDLLRDRLSEVLGDDFLVEKLLGRGGMGSVYLAREASLDRLVAIKVLPPERAQSADLRERFRREARTAAQLSHPNIVPLLTFGEEDGLMFFVMGFVEGEPLSQRVQREGRLQVGEATRILSELAGALGYAHGRGVVHRDVKPENILRLESAKSARSSVLAGLRRLHGAARRLAAAKGDAIALADFEAACQMAVASGETAVVTNADTQAREPG